MKVYTTEDVRNFKRDKLGRLFCPSGDYTQVKSFGACCRFGADCKFGENCSFGADCRFETYCRFGENCRFDEHCRFGEYCSFGADCIFGKNCSFGGDCCLGADCNFKASCRFSECCYFGEHCKFDEDCRFGENCLFCEGCIFGSRCRFGECCDLENGHIFEWLDEVVERVIKIDCIGSRKGCTYFFKTISKIYVRCGCWFGTLEEFETAVNKTHEDNEQYLKEYTEAIKYIRAVM